MELIKLLAQGKTVKEIAYITGTNVRTLEKRIETLKRESKCENIVQLVVEKLAVEDEKLHADMMQVPTLRGLIS